MTLTACPVGATLVLALGLRASPYCGAFSPLGSTEVLPNIENEEGLGKNTGTSVSRQTTDRSFRISCEKY